MAPSEEQCQEGHWEVKSLGSIVINLILFIYLFIFIFFLNNQMVQLVLKIFA